MKQLLSYRNCQFRQGSPSPARTIRWLLAAMTTVLGLSPARAQVNLYTFSQQTNGTYTALPAPTVLATSSTTSSTTTDDAVYTVALPFAVTYNSVAYASGASLRVSTNGFVTFGTTAPSSTNYLPISSTSGYAGAIAALGGDLYGSTTASGLGELGYQTLGTAPNRTLVVQWKNYARYVSSYITENLNFQVQLDEGTNVIRLVYGSFTPTTTSTPQVGLRGTSTVYNNRTTTTNWSASAAGTTSSATMTLSSTVKPASGLTFIYTPPQPCTAPPTAGTAVATQTNGCSTVSSTLSLTGSATGTGVTYQWQQSATGLAGSFTNITGATSATYSATGITADTYFQAIVTCSGQSATSGVAVVRVYSAAPSTYAALPVAETFESWVSRCGNAEVPSNNWRATPITGDNSWRRNDQGFSTAGWRYINDEPAPYQIASSQGSYSARFHSYGTNSGGTGSLDLFVNLSTAGTKTLAFDYYNASGTDQLSVQLSEDGGVTFPTTLLTLGTAAVFNGQSVVIASTSATAVIRFKATSDFGNDDIGLDNLRLALTPACAAVVFAPTTAITQNSATVNFAAASGGSSYSLTYSPGGATPQSVTPGAVNLTGLLPYTLYTVTVVTNCGGGQTNTASTSFRTPIGNDECAGAVTLTPGAAGASCTAQTYTTLNATNSAGVTNSCAAPVGGDVWFSFVAGGSTHTITVVPTFDLDPVIDLRSSTGGCPGTSLQCQDASSSGGSAGTETLTATGLTAGATYFVRVYSTFASTSYNFDICITTPANVPCAQVTSPSVTTASGTATASTGTLTFTAAAGASNYYLTLTPTAGGPTNTATVSGSPVSLTGLTPNTSYTITISTSCSNGGVSNPVSVVFTSAPAPAPPTNDDCGGAIGLTVSTSCTPTTGTTVGATASTATGSCVGTADDDVWYSFVATASAQTITVVGSANFDAVVNLRSGACPGVLVGSCADDTGSGGTETIAATGLTPGATYYVRVFEYYSTGSSSGAPGPFTICVTGPAPVTDLVVDGTNSPYSASGTYNNVTINSGGLANLSANLTVQGTLTINSGGTLNTAGSQVLGTGNFVLQAGGTLGIAGVNGITTGPATTGVIRNTGATRSFSPDANYVYNGTAAQTTGNGLPSQVRSLTVNNSTGLTLAQALSVRQLVRLQSGDLATGGNTFTLLSVAGQGTALIDNSGGVVTGTGTMQRAIDVTNAAGTGYRHYAAPVSNTSVADLAAPGYAPVLNPTYNTSATPSLVRPFPTVFGYDEGRIATTTSTYSAFDKGWFSPAATSDAMQAGRGYTVNIADGTLVDFVGTFTSGASSRTGLTRGLDPSAGWHLLGNPYPSSLNWDLVDDNLAANLPGMDAAVYLYQSTGQYTGTFRNYVNGVGNPLIDAGQGYFVRVAAAGTTGSVNLTNAHRVTTFDAQPTFGRGTADLRPLLTLGLSGSGQTDETTVYFEAGATAGADSRFDAVKRLNIGSVSLASLLNGQDFAINGLAPLTSLDVVVPLVISNATAGSYTFRTSELNNFGTTTVWLRDAQTGAQVVLAPGSSYAFTLATAGAGASRFSLLFRPGNVTATRSELAAQVLLYPNPAHGSFTLSVPSVPNARTVQATLLNALGQQVLTRTLPLSTTGTVAEFSTASLATGVYTLQLRAGESLVTKRVVVE